MSTILTVNDNNDIFATSNDRLSVTTGLAAVLQACQHAVEIRRGELPYNRSEGIDYFTILFNGSPNFLVFESQARERILSVDTVESVLDFEINLNENTAEYTATIQSTLGTGVINGSI